LRVLTGARRAWYHRASMFDDTLVIVLAGGAGERLYPLT
jgi:hypothetical protein